MQIIGDIARKQGDGELLAVEMEKSRAAARIGTETGLFRVPNLSSFDRDAGVLDFEFIPNLVTFGEMVARDLPERDELAHRAGKAIAFIHQRLQLDDSLRIDLPNPWKAPDDESVFFHGDLTANNICVNLDARELVFLDWSASPLIGRRATLGPREFDLVCFARHLIVAAPWRKTLSWPGTRLSDQFIQGYAETSETPLARKRWDFYAECMREFSAATMKDRIAHAAPLSRPGKAVCQRILLGRWERYAPAL